MEFDHEEVASAVTEPAETSPSASEEPSPLLLSQLLRPEQPENGLKLHREAAESLEDALEILHL
jgi:hypothetical protein